VVTKKGMWDVSRGVNKDANDVVSLLV
jgi:hypothetical protein